MHLASADQKLINLLQAKFPLTREPYADLGLSLGMVEDEVMQRIGNFKTKGLIREISPVFETRNLGYRTTLVAMRVVESRLDKATELLNEHPGVSHAYERDHNFNLWFTLAVPYTGDMEAELRQLAKPIEPEVTFELPALKVFKLRAYFSRDEDVPPADTETVGSISQGVQLSAEDRRVINELQQDLPLLHRPFAGMSARLGMNEEEFLERCLSLRSLGILRRYGALVNHRRAGFAANSMTCWAVPEAKVEIIGRKLASLSQVSHCYERKTNSFWRYNLFAMIHAHARDECKKIADEVSIETGLEDHVLLFSTREFKKTRVKYLV